jgi:peptidoglycan/xylan/chitin deacetylase (PgdA/CDA1 family)
MYHQVGDFAPMQGHRSTYCHYTRFAAQMAYLHRLRYNVLRLDAVVDMLAGRASIPPRAVGLTFDDGYENFYEYAYPELSRYGFPATVYLLSGFLGRKAEWFARDGRATPELMNAARVRELDRAGIDFGSHGVSHVKLAEVNPEKAREEITRSRTELADVLGHDVRHFCYPYGSVNQQVVEIARNAGYRSAVTCVRALAAPGADLLALPRKAISFGDSLAGYAWKLHYKNKPKEDPLAASAPPGG